MVYSIYAKWLLEVININWRERLVKGRATALLEAIERVEARGGRVPQRDRPLGRVGVAPGIWVGDCNNVGERTTCGRREVSQLEPHPGDLSFRRCQGLAFNTPIINHVSQYPTARRGRG